MTDSGGLRSDCNPSNQTPASPHLINDYRYDPLDRLLSYRTFSGGGNPTDEGDYVYDALNRLVQETELHPSFNPDRHTTQFSYLGQSGLETEEQQTSKNSGNTLSVKDLTYDVYGHRLAMTTTPYANGVAGTPTTSTYGYDVHGSVSQLVDPNGNTTASYGYTPYGQSDSTLSQGDTDKTNPINPFRYSATRLDTGSGSLDMVVRRFGPDTAHFLTPDFFYGSLADLSLSIDPLTQNRYSLAGGNPISFKEWTGHQFIEDGGGGAATIPTSRDAIRSIARPTPTTTRDDQRQLPCAPSSLENLSEYERYCPPPTRPIPNVATYESQQNEDSRAGIRNCGPALSVGALLAKPLCDFSAARGGKGGGDGIRGRIAGFLGALGLGGGGGAGGGAAGQIAAKLTEKAAQQEAKNPDASDQATDLAVRNPLTQHAADQMGGT